MLNLKFETEFKFSAKFKVWQSSKLIGPLIVRSSGTHRALIGHSSPVHHPLITRSSPAHHRLITRSSHTHRLLITATHLSPAITHSRHPLTKTVVFESFDHALLSEMICDG